MSEWKVTPVDEPMTLRDRFASAALMGVLNNAESRIFPMKHQEDRSNAEILAENCYFMADAMLKERLKARPHGGEYSK